MAREDKVVQDLIKGIDFLLKKTKSPALWEQPIFRPQEVEVTEGQSKKILKANRAVILATGSAPVFFPGARVDEVRVVSSSGVFNLKKFPIV